MSSRLRTTQAAGRYGPHLWVVACAALLTSGVAVGSLQAAPAAATTVTAAP